MELAIVGAGKVAERNYIPALLRHPDVSLTCYSRTLARAQAVGAKFGVPVVGSIEALFETQPEAIFVLTGERQHPQPR